MVCQSLDGSCGAATPGFESASWPLCCFAEVAVRTQQLMALQACVLLQRASGSSSPWAVQGPTDEPHLHLSPSQWVPWSPAHQPHLQQHLGESTPIGGQLPAESGLLRPSRSTGVPHSAPMVQSAPGLDVGTGRPLSHGNGLMPPPQTQTAALAAFHEINAAAPAAPPGGSSYTTFSHMALLSGSSCSWHDAATQRCGSRACCACLHGLSAFLPPACLQWPQPRCWQWL
jgi:hypothetical protein